MIAGANEAETEAVSRIKSPERKRARKATPPATLLKPIQGTGASEHVTVSNNEKSIVSDQHNAALTTAIEHP